MANEKIPKVTSLLLSDAHRAAENGKIDAYGLFTKFIVWAVPATRECSIIAKIDNAPAGQAKFDVLVQDQNKVSRQVGVFSLKSETRQPSALAALGIALTFSKSGNHKIGIKPEGGSDRQIFWFSFLVEVLPWLELPTGKQLESLLSDPHSIKHMRASLTCSNCGKTYTFELSLDPAKKRERGIRPFPPSKKFKCPSCSKSHNLGDIEGQLRFHLVNQSKGA